MNITNFAPKLFSAISSEPLQQEHHIGLIASENYCSPRVLEAQCLLLGNKYAEGRYYGGCEYVNAVETLAIDRAKLFVD